MEEAGQVTELHVDYEAFQDLIIGIDFEAIKDRTLGKRVFPVKIKEGRYWRRHEVDAWIAEITQPT